MPVPQRLIMMDNALARFFIVINTLKLCSDAPYFQLSYEDLEAFLECYGVGYDKT
jgi:hypothetical protein